MNNLYFVIQATMAPWAPGDRLEWRQLKVNGKLYNGPNYKTFRRLNFHVSAAEL